MKNSYAIYGGEKWEQYFIDFIAKYLLSKNYDVQIREKMAFSLGIPHDNWYGVLRKNIIIQNNETKRFFGINHADQQTDVPIELLQHPFCVGILKCQCKPGIYEEHENKVCCFVYGVKEPQHYFPLRQELRGVKRETRTLFFKGNETCRLNILRLLARMNLINQDYGIRDRNGCRNKKISQKEYLAQMASSRLALSLPGNGNCCHRELEAFGLGVPVLMPVLQNRYYRPLIPNVHYIAVDTACFGEKKVKHYTKDEEKLLCEMIKARYEEVIDDDDFQNYIIENASVWFSENIEYPANMVLLETILAERFGHIL